VSDYVLVPREPTPAMLDAARDWSLKTLGRPVGNDGARGCYAAMLAAAPQPPTGSVCTCPSGDGSLRWPCPVHARETILAQQAEIERLREDAERYRWLRGNASEIWWIDDKGGNWTFTDFRYDAEEQGALSAAIDAARSAE